MKDNQQELPNTNRSKKKYEQPQLQVYGDLRDITQSHMKGMDMDSSGAKGLDKTN